MLGVSVAKWMLLVRYGEIALKSPWSRSRMEKRLASNIEDALESEGIEASVSVSGARLWICCFEDEERAAQAAEVVARVMGVVSVSPVIEIRFSDLEDLCTKARDFFSPRVKGRVFAVRAHRVGHHEFTSKDVEKVLGRMLLEAGAARVDLENPEYEAFVEIRGSHAYLFDKVIRGPGGLPIGTEGRGRALFSGGIDSPVATWFAMKRGCEAHMVLFNIGGDPQVYSALAVAKILADRWGYGYRPKLFVVDVRPFVLKIAQYSPEEYMVIILRRLMMKLATALAREIGAEALVTGESLGQVASQTLRNLAVIDEASELPVLRPLIGMDKQEITDLARRIGTYDLSSKMVEYCPMGARKVTTRASLEKAKEIEERMGIDSEEIAKAVQSRVEFDLRAIPMEEILEKLKTVSGGCPR